MYIYNRIMVKNTTKFQVLRVSCKLLYITLHIHIFIFFDKCVLTLSYAAL